LPRAPVLIILRRIGALYFYVRDLGFNDEFWGHYTNYPDEYDMAMQLDQVSRLTDKSNTTLAREAALGNKPV
jgi:hypothetical protein